MSEEDIIITNEEYWRIARQKINSLTKVQIEKLIVDNIEVIEVPDPCYINIKNTQELLYALKVYFEKFI